MRRLGLWVAGLLGALVLALLLRQPYQRWQSIPLSAVPEAALTEVWSQPLELAFSDVGYGLAISAPLQDGLLYSDDANMLAVGPGVAASALPRIRTLKLTPGIEATADGAGGYVVGSLSYTVVRLGPDGMPLWRTQLPQAPQHDHGLGLTCTAVDGDGNVYAANRNYLYELDATHGTVLNTKPLLALHSVRRMLWVRDRLLLLGDEASPALPSRRPVLLSMSTQGNQLERTALPRGTYDLQQLNWDSVVLGSRDRLECYGLDGVRSWSVCTGTSPTGRPFITTPAGSVATWEGRRLIVRNAAGKIVGRPVWLGALPRPGAGFGPNLRCTPAGELLVQLSASSTVDGLRCAVLRVSAAGRPLERYSIELTNAHLMGAGSADTLYVLRHGAVIDGNGFMGRRQGEVHVLQPVPTQAR
jgi:hypothetical protein